MQLKIKNKQNRLLPTYFWIIKAFQRNKKVRNRFQIEEITHTNGRVVKYGGNRWQHQIRKNLCMQCWKIWGFNLEGHGDNKGKFSACENQIYPWEGNLDIRVKKWRGSRQKVYVKVQRRADEAMWTQISNWQSAFDFLVDQSLGEDRKKDESQISILDDKINNDAIIKIGNARSSVAGMPSTKIMNIRDGVGLQIIEVD